nr:MAG TPA: hypothetical protein [Caudoviricetes sp.]
MCGGFLIWRHVLGVPPFSYPWRVKTLIGV